MISIVENCDCMKFMAKYPDKYFELAIVDPPYGIGAGSEKFINGTSKNQKLYYKKNDWDKKPSKEYFNELKRVSQNQIIWGGNYFAEYLGNFRCFIFWDKTIHGNSYADGEIAWTSFDQVARYFRENIAQTNSEGRIHPTQKSIRLYIWLLQNYAKPGDKILDTHLGSQSSRIAAYQMGFDFYGCELDKEYFEQGCARYEKEASQLMLLTV
jgi:site-specific DNA-methyltransferase (adenine-specific)